ncbi:hypothetical protein [Rhizobium leguminosarum]|uniref:hypothetical protein n=1 Tax=Rhizobium leguminosarum TaxID=384 RepID=UPI0021BBF2EA|nr:hypothetical protein [Rhizobium leguminosarum]
MDHGRGYWLGAPALNSARTIDDRPVGEERLADALGAALAAFKDARQEGTDGQTATWFDILTVSALLIFSLEGVEWAVLETGLGGRRNSTNIVQSDVLWLSPISILSTPKYSAKPARPIPSASVARYF